MSSLQREGGVVAEGGLPFANKWGGVLLISSVGFVTALLAYWAVCKWRQGRRSWDRLPAGSLRLAAARNSIENLELLSLLPVGDAGPGQDTCRRCRPLPPVPPSSLAPRMQPSPQTLNSLACSQGFDVDAAHEGFTALLAAAVQGHAGVWMTCSGAVGDLACWAPRA